ncbi:MAG: hypothetical protein KF754_03495 [Planctomycetes bacterium]|nr:hypothetical protein [Planctomycetota bacterium]
MTPAPVDPAQQAAASRKRLDAMAGVRRWIRRLRLVMGAAVLLLGVYAWLSYRLYTLPGTFDPKLRTAQFPMEGLQPGDTVVLQNLNLWREPKLGDVVIYRNTNPTDGAPESLIGRVVGMPGESVQRRGPTMAVGGRQPLGVGFDLGDARINDGDVIPQGSYMIVADLDSLPYIDSRALGYVHGDAITRRVVLNLTAWQGRPLPTP